VDLKTKSLIAKLVEEAEEATDPKTNGLMDRDEFPVMIQKLLVTIQYLVAECESAELPKENDTFESEISSYETDHFAFPLMRFSPGDIPSPRQTLARRREYQS
jgi:hypothetical protein